MADGKMIENIEFGREISLGLLIGGIFIILNVAFGLVIGIPTLAFSSDTEKYIIRDGIAPIVEEAAFRGLLAFATFAVLSAVGIEGMAAFVLALAVNAAAFIAFHFAAYGSNIAAASSLFIGAGVFAIAAFLTTYYNSDADEFQVPIAAIIGHAIINTWLGIKAAGFIFVGG